MRLILPLLLLLQVPLPPPAAVSTTPAATALSMPIPKNVPWPLPTDLVAPLVNSIKMGTVDVLTNSAMLTSGSEWTFTVNATDNQSVVAAVLLCDGVAVAWKGSLNALPATFKLVVSEKSLAPGAHRFTLKVFDASANAAGVEWTMVKP